LAANRDEDGTLPEQERNLLAQDKIRKENFSGKTKDLLWHQRNPRARNLKTRPLEQDSTTGMKNLIQRPVHAIRAEKLRAARYSTSEQIFHRAGNKTKNKRVLGERKLKTEQQA
jgi:hypothetical protein